MNATFIDFLNSLDNGCHVENKEIQYPTCKHTDDVKIFQTISITKKKIRKKKKKSYIPHDISFNNL